MNVTKQHIADMIKEYLDEHRQDMFSYLKDMVAIESPSNNKKALKIIIQFLETKLKALGFYTIHVSGKKTGGYLYARPKNRKKHGPLQLLLGHCDTVWGLKTIESMPIVQINGKLKGPGVYDMKAGLTEIIFALSAIKKLKLDLPITPIVLINTDEEIGSHESTLTIKKLSKIVDRAFVLEPPLGIEGKLKTERKGIGRFIITIKGKAAHAGLDPEKGVNAIIELAHQVQQLHAMNDFEKGITVNVGLIEGGKLANVVAAESHAVVDVRVNSIQDGKYITKKIHQLKPMLNGIKLIVDGGIGRPPMEKNYRNQQLWKLAQSNAKLLNLSLEEASAGGGSDGNTTSLYTATLDGLGTTGDGAHAKHEFIFVDKLIERTTLLTLLLLEKSTYSSKELKV